MALIIDGGDAFGTVPSTGVLYTPVVAGTVIQRVRELIVDLDAANYRWTDDELLDYLSDAQRVLATSLPDSSSVIDYYQLDAGTRQDVPADGYMLLDVTRNIRADGHSPGRAIRIIARDVLDAFDPEWHSATPSGTVKHYVYDNNTPLVYYVYPPNDGTGIVEMNYSRTPQDLTSMDDRLQVNDIYQTALMDYVMFRAHQKDSDYAAGQATANQYLQQFMAQISNKVQSQASASPTQETLKP